jgi:hypothetical protein
MQSARRHRIPGRFDEPDYLQKLLAAGARASTLGIAILDSQTRFELVNASLSRETRVVPDHHVGRTSREVVGDLALQVEPIYEKVLRTAKAASVQVAGHVRDTPEFGYWLTHCFPIKDNSGRTQQLGVFVVNATAEKASAEIFEALATHPKRLMADAAGLLDKFDESVRHYHAGLRRSFRALASPLAAPAGKAERFRYSIERLDSDITEMRELIYAVISQFSLPAC